MWRASPVSFSLSFGPGESSSEKKKRRKFVPIEASVPNKSKIEDIVVIDDPESPTARGVSEMVKQEVGDSDYESNLSKPIVSAADRRHGWPHNAVALFQHMQQTGFHLNHFLFDRVLPHWAKNGSFLNRVWNRSRHNEWRLLSDTTVGNALIDMYAKCGSISRARELFARMTQKKCGLMECHD
ncbi:putative pentatricopeptide repeat-containing protein At3g08820 [Cryptomeria japonica]|uniref:putative pentatricopeptide repeat-containing protein At3g08820 n=1 Tax=Cryptomeria japonica TaxID=3369 RepID=UPI0027DA456C|nr:putative pentatricopeptide repeat-containing protein At3g08820 [Cryptomeria japonica]